MNNSDIMIIIMTQNNDNDSNAGGVGEADDSRNSATVM